MATRIRARPRAGARNSCSQSRTTRQPARRNARFTRRSRARFAASLARQNRLPVRPVPLPSARPGA